MFDWLQNFSDWLIYSVLNLSASTKLGTALNFFVYDTIKILILLFVIVFIMGIVNAYLPVEKLKDFLHRKKLFGLEYLFASVFGAITPFCSCSSVPLLRRIRRRKTHFSRAPARHYTWSLGHRKRCDHLRGNRYRNRCRHARLCSRKLF
ncbi:MAG: permease [Flavobacteriales bacterium]|nr:permease [Flavobacteriales bacterium]